MPVDMYFYIPYNIPKHKNLGAAMGRLRKSIIDMIIKLRKKGYTQAETAEKAGVNLKTVQKYDPLRQPKKATSINSAKGGSIDDLEYCIKLTGDWVDSIITTLRANIDAELICPKCMQGKLAIDDEGNVYFCKKCRYVMPLLSYLMKED